MQNIQSFLTKDGSKTLYHPQFDEHYHSVNGAKTESNHVFIQAGLAYFHQKQPKTIHVFEMGFGTGLNAYLSYCYAKEQVIPIQYTTVEAYPLNWAQVEPLNYPEGIEPFHSCPWEKPVEFSPLFTLTKLNATLHAVTESKQYNNAFDVIFYDAFAPSAQPQLWSLEVFNRLFSLLKQGGVVTTYCAKGQVKRDLRSAGFEVQSLPGPPGKREMTRAIKP